MTVAVCIPSIPTRGSLLAEALLSVAMQTRPADEVHVAVDHGHAGEAATRNRALAAATTKWVAFLDDDDVLYPQHLEHLVAHAEETRADVVYPWFNSDEPGVADAEGRPFDADRLRAGNYIPVTLLVRCSAALSVGGFPAPGWHLERGLDLPDNGCPCVDWGFLLNLLDDGARISHLPERTWWWRRHAAATNGLTW